MTTPPVLWFGPDADAPEGAVVADLQRLVETRLLITGSSGAGKSRMIRALAEETYGTVQQILLDHEGDFFTLGERFPYLLAGPEGYAPVTPSTAAPLARLLVEQPGVSAVIDLSGLRPPERRRFVRLFAEALMGHLERLPRAARSPRLVIVDECQVYAPERGMGAESEAGDALVDLATRGRKYGVSLVAACQRVSDLRKSITDLCNNKIVGYTDSGPTLDTAAALLGFRAAERRLIAELDPSTFFARGPAIRRTPVLVRTGETRTTHPRLGELVPPVPPAPDALRALIEKIALDSAPSSEADAAGLPAHAASSPFPGDAALRRRISELEEDLRAVRRELVRARASEDAQSARAAAFEGLIRSVRPSVETLCKTLSPAALNDAAAMVTPSATAVTIPSDTTPIMPSVTGDTEDAVIPRPAGDAISPDLGALPCAPAAPATAAMPAGAEEDQEHQEDRDALPQATTPAANHSPGPSDLAAFRALPRAQQRILQTLATFEVIGVRDLDRRNVAVYSEQSPKSSAFGQHLKLLADAGLVGYSQPGRVAVTGDGFRITPSSAGAPRTRRELQEAWYRQIKQPAKVRILKVLIDSYPRPLPRHELAHRTGQSITSSAFGTHIADLEELGLVHYPSRGHVVATGLLFPEGLPE